MKDCAHFGGSGGNIGPHSARALHSIDELRQWLNYDSETGALTWKRSPIGWLHAGRPVGSVMRSGYIRFTFQGTGYLAHRVAFALVHGRWPLPECDHINGIKTDNRIANLREATRGENNANRRKHRESFSGIKNVFFRKETGKWQARVTANSRAFSRSFCSVQDAAAHARQLREQLHGEFARH